MQCKWLGERVAAPNLRTIVRNVATKEPAGNWGPNALFRFPTRGGTGGIWTAVADLIPSTKFRLGEKHGGVNTIQAGDKSVTMADGRVIRYKNLVTTMALDSLLDRLEGVNLGGMISAKEGLIFSSTIVIGIGIRGARPPKIGDKCESKSSI